MEFRAKNTAEWSNVWQLDRRSTILSSKWVNEGVKGTHLFGRTFVHYSKFKYFGICEALTFLCHLLCAHVEIIPCVAHTYTSGTHIVTREEKKTMKKDEQMAEKSSNIISEQPPLQICFLDNWNGFVCWQAEHRKWTEIRSSELKILAILIELIVLLHMYQNGIFFSFAFIHCALKINDFHMWMPTALFIRLNAFCKQKGAHNDRHLCIEMT